MHCTTIVFLVYHSICQYSLSVIIIIIIIIVIIIIIISYIFIIPGQVKAAWEKARGSGAGTEGLPYIYIYIHR